MVYYFKISRLLIWSIMNEIKLIIWDLDDTLWQGTLAEQEEVLLNKEVIDRINFLLDRGIVHSISSKNDSKKAEEKLIQLGIYELFIFPKICFENKGLQIKKIMKKRIDVLPQVFTYIYRFLKKKF